MDTVYYKIFPNSSVHIAVAGFQGRVIISAPLDQPATVEVILDEKDPDSDETFQLRKDGEEA